MEEVHARHRNEQRELQGRITQKKKNATKKTRKGINDECDVLQREMNERHRAELAAFDNDHVLKRLEDMGLSDGRKQGEGSDNPAQVETVEEEVTGIGSDAASMKTAPLQTQPKKPNRQKARLARRAAEQEAQVTHASQEAATLPDRRSQEMEAMKRQMKKLGLIEISIRPDGHCLYSAIARSFPEDQILAGQPKVAPYQMIRNNTSEYISSHPDDFAAFLEEPVEQYVHKIRNTAEWGGQLELQAIAQSFSVPIYVLQADGRVERILPKTPSSLDVIWLAYYRHSFGLGEHYNALEKTP